MASSPINASRHPEIILASGSRYRKQMLERLRLPFSVIPADIDESAEPGENAEVLAARLSLTKAQVIANHHPQAIVIGADQVAECDGRLLGKPGTIETAVKQLQHCSGQTMVFHSGLALIGRGRTLQTVVPTEVRMRELSEAEIRRYVEQDRPLDCAGAMRSESLGITLTSAISSDDPTALIGMPLITISQLLRELGITLP